MKKLHICGIMGGALILLFSLFPCQAINTGLQVEEIQENPKDIIDNLNITAISDVSDVSGFSNFDVNEDQHVVLAFSNQDNKKIGVYDKEGSFLYGYSFECSGSFLVEWDQSNVLIYLGRSDLLISIAPNASCVEVKKVLNTADNNTYRNRVLCAEEKKIDDIVFRADLWWEGIDVFKIIQWGEYPKLLKILPSGEEIVIFDNSGSFNQQVTIGVVVFLIFFLSVITSLVLLLVRKSQTENAI